MRCRTFSGGLIISLIAVSSGCSMWHKNGVSSKPDKGWSISKLWKREYQQPHSLAAIWSPDVLTVSGQTPTRGFGGRVFFYNELTQAIPVDGKLVVHGYRNQPALGQSDQVPADKIFAFTPEQLTQHFSPSELGASYSVWIPWDAADGFREEVTLIPTFVSKDGSIVQGAAAKAFLPGRSLDLTDKSTTFAAQTVAYQQRSIPTNPGIELPRLRTGMKVTNIPVPPSATLNRAPVQPTSYTLSGVGSNPNSAQAVGGGLGVGVGGPLDAGNPTIPRRSDLLPAREQPSATQPGAIGLPPLPGSDIKLPGVDGQDLAPASSRHMPQMRSPIAFQPWASQPNQLQPTSENAK